MPAMAVVLRGQIWLKKKNKKILKTVVYTISDLPYPNVKKKWPTANCE